MDINKEAGKLIEEIDNCNSGERAKIITESIRKTRDKTLDECAQIAHDSFQLIVERKILKLKSQWNYPFPGKSK